jgi:hypothetical protein
MAEFLKKEWGITATVLHDKPQDFFHRATLQETHELFKRLSPELGISLLLVLVLLLHPLHYHCPVLLKTFLLLFTPSYFLRFLFLYNTRNRRGRDNSDTEVEIRRDSPKRRSSSNSDLLHILDSGRRLLNLFRGSSYSRM